MGAGHASRRTWVESFAATERGTAPELLRNSQEKAALQPPLHAKQGKDKQGAH